MGTLEISLAVAGAGLGVTLGGIFVRLGRVLERQSVHCEELRNHREELDELAHGHGKTQAAFEGLQGEIRGLKTTMDSLGNTLRECIARLDRHMERG